MIILYFFAPAARRSPFSLKLMAYGSTTQQLQQRRRQWKGCRGFQQQFKLQKKQQFYLRKKSGKSMEKLMKLMKLLLSFGAVLDETQQLVEVARTSWSPALNLDSFVAMNFSGPDILRLQSLVMLGWLLQPQAVPESTSHLKPGDISHSNSSWIPGGVVTPTHCQKGRWGEHNLRSTV